jgi:AbrB family looped-hinge helix DNA binding protein
MKVKKGRERLISARISAKGQITLPRKIRKALAVEPGDRLVFALERGSVFLRPLGPCHARDLAASLQEYARPAAGDRPIREVVKKEVALAAVRQA